MDLNTISLKQPLNPKIFSDIAEAAASYIFPQQKRDKKGNLSFDNKGNPIYEKHNQSTQIRKYYDELSMWDDKIHRAADKNAEYQKSAPYIHMLRAKVAYASNRKSSGTPLVDEYFVRIFNHIINQIDSAETLHHAKLFYEAMLGFRKAQESK